MCENIGVYNRHFNECRLLFFVTCQGAICAINDVPYNETAHTHEILLGIYILNVIKVSKDIYIEVKDWTKKDFQMIIDARKIIFNWICHWKI